MLEKKRMPLREANQSINHSMASLWLVGSLMDGLDAGENQSMNGQMDGIAEPSFGWPCENPRPLQWDVRAQLKEHA